MTTYAYFTLSTDDSIGSPPAPTLYKKFRVVEGGYKPSREKKQSDETTLEGLPDIAQGSIYRTFQYIIKARDEDPESDEDYGNYEDLVQFYEYNNPNGSPSNILTLVDHKGASHQVMFMGSLAEEPATVMLEGINAIYFTPVNFKKVG